MSFWDNFNLPPQSAPRKGVSLWSHFAYEQVPPIEVEDPRILIVGEAPGQQEKINGAPFVGASGRFMASCGVSAGLFIGDPWRESLPAFWRRNKCYVTNIVWEHPENDNFTLFTASARDVAVELGCSIKDVHKHTYKIGGRYLLPRLTQYIEKLSQTIETARPNLILAVGGKAATILCGASSIRKSAGYITKGTLVPDTKVLPIIHPAAVLRQPTMTPIFTMYLMRAALEAETPDIYYDDVTVIIDPTYEEVLQFFAQQHRNGWPASSCDIETNPALGIITDISISAATTHGISIPFVRGGKPYWTLEQECMIWRILLTYFHHTKSIIWQNGTSYDLVWIRDYFRRFGLPPYNPWKNNQLHDTLNLLHTLQPEFPLNLNSMSSYLLRRPQWKHLRKRAKDKLKQDE